MGDTGPCGPSTEIFYDHGEHIWGGPPGSAEEDGDRFIEIWNNVFMQYEQIDADTRIDLPNQSIDTGMGLERITATLMGSHDNYEIDIMRDLRQHVADLTGVDFEGDMAASHRVIADHIRCASFLMADGVMPSNEGRGYVLRRIMRRGMRHAHLLGAADPLMHKLFPTLLSSMGEAYPELKRAESLITQTLESEEQRFKVTLDRGLKMLDEETEKMAGDQFPGDVAFKLYDTFGFPLDLTQDALRAREIEVDTDAFDKCMEAQKAAARAAWKGSGDTANEQIWFDLLEEHGPTEFTGYDAEQAEAQVLAIVVNGNKVDNSDNGEVQIITNQTPFYAESGGQVGDSGIITMGELKIEITDTRKQVGKLHVHVGNIIKASIRANHSVTHLMHEALRRVLGDHVSQKGSLQDVARTRFDISHPKGVSNDEIAQVEAIVTEQIAANTPVVTRVMPIDEARETGAMALFGEKYEDEVRVVAMGTFESPSPSGEGRGEGQPNKQFSVELCGGTHVKETGQIGAFKITSEGALSSGIRRLEAVTGDNVVKYLSQKDAANQETFDRLSAENKKLREELASLGGSFDDATPAVQDDIIKQNKALQKQIADLRRASGAATSDDEIKDINGTKFIGKVLDGFPPKDLKPMADDLKQKLGSGIVALVATNDGKASIVVGVTADLTDKYNAVDLVKIGSEALGGKGGGGRPDMDFETLKT